MSLHHGWGWQPPQTASHIHIHIKHIQSVWEHSYAIHRHTGAASYTYIHPSWPRIWPLATASVMARVRVTASLATAMSIHLDPSQPSPKIIQPICPYLTCISKYLLTDVSILRTIRWISKTICQYLSKYSSMCLIGSIHASYHFTHTMVLMYLVRTNLHTVHLFTCPKYNKMTRNRGVWKKTK